MRSFISLIAALIIVLPLRAQDAGEKTQDQKPAGEAVFALKRILISDTEEKAVAMKAPADGEAITVKDVPILETFDFQRYAKPILGRPITKETLGMLMNGIKAYVRSHDRLVVSVQIPTQTISTGEVRVAVIIGRYNNVVFQGNKWFSSATLEKRLGVKPGDEVRLSELNEAVTWTNANPFRKIKVLVNDQLPDPGKADLIVNVKEEFPLHAAFAVDNQGNDILGVYRFTASGQYGNLWGKDHEVSSQITTSDKPGVYQAHSMDYRIPLPWHHFIRAAAAYGLVTPSFYNGDFHLKGQSLLTSLNYSVPMEFSWGSAELNASLDFKQSNNNLEYGGTAIRSTKVDIFQFGLEGTVTRRDKWGAWVGAMNLNLSPGGMNDRNSDTTYESVRTGARARYASLGIQFQRLVNLPHNFQLFARGNAQFSSTNLQATEEMTIGGATTVRGYEERIQSGDEGFLASVEFQSPVIGTALPKSVKITQPLLYRGLIFWDFGEIWTHTKMLEDIQSSPLMSAGIGLRCSIGNNFNMSADYGWQLRATHPRSQPEGGRFSVRATMTY